MTSRLKSNLTYVKQTPTLDNLSGREKVDKKTYHAWAMRLNVTKNAELIQKASDAAAELPTTTGKLSALKDRLNALKERLKGRVPHGWNARLNRSDPTASGGVIEPEQVFVTRKRLTFPGTDRPVRGRAVTLYEKTLDTNKALSAPEQVGEVIAYELGDSFLLFRKVDDPAAGEATAVPDPNKDRILVICAHGLEETKWTVKGGAEIVPMTLPDDITFLYGVPSGYDSDGTTKYGDSEIGKYVKEMPTFAAVTKTSEGSELAAFPLTNKLRKLMRSGGPLSQAVFDAKRLFRLATGTDRPGHVADASLEKYQRIRNGHDRFTKDRSTKVPPIVYTRGGDTYDQVAFAALNDKKADIVTVRNGKIPKKSDLIKALDKLGIRSQYRIIYDPSCRDSEVVEGTAPVWKTFKDNVPVSEELGFVRRTKNPDGTPGFEEARPDDEDVQQWMGDSSNEAPELDRDGEGTQDTNHQQSIEIPLD